ncbi:MAG: YihY/virulence factor BrkB family protein [Myxococcota bacterium]
MSSPTTPIPQLNLADLATMVRRLGQFAWRVMAHFGRNKGLLLAGAVAYNALLSIIPLFGIILFVLSWFFDEGTLILIAQRELELIVPGQADALMTDIVALVENPRWVGGLSLIVLLFFSGLAFRMLEDAMAIIFKKTEGGEKRRFWISALIPYGYLLVIGLSIIAFSTLSALLELIQWQDTTFFGVQWSFSQATGTVIYVSGLLGQVLMFTSLYVIMPVVDIPWQRALVGGLTAAVLWEITRHVLIWYFKSVSMVSLIYGSLTTVVVVLLTLEIATVIILLGAQVIAELEHSAQADLQWYEEPLITEPNGDDKPSDLAEAVDAA